MQEILQTLSSYGLSIPEHKAREIEVDLERLTSKIEHLRCQNDVLQLSLEESKSNADRLTMLVGKYESNNTALQLAVNYSEQTIEAQEVVLALKESEQSVLLANCKAAGVGLGTVWKSGKGFSDICSSDNCSGFYVNKDTRLGLPLGFRCGVGFGILMLSPG